MSEGHTDGRYANHFSVGHNALEFVIDFAQFYRERADIDSHTRIVTLPQYAKALSQTLRESLDRYEQTFGPIPASNGSDTGIAAHCSAADDSVDFEQGRLAMPERPAQPDEKQPGKYGSRRDKGGGPPRHPAPPEPPPYETRPPAGYPTDPSWQHEPPAHTPPQYEPDPYGAPPPESGYDSWQRDEHPPGHEAGEYGKPSEELAGLKTKLEDRQAEIAALSKQRDTLKQDIDGLETAVTELTQIVAAYELVSKAIEKDKRDLDLYVATKTPMLEVAVKEKKDTIERIIEEADCEIQEARDRLEQLDAAAQEAAQALEAAKANEEQERTSYNALKDGYKQIEAKLKQLKTLRDTIEKDYDDTNKMAGMYFLLKELKAELASIQILSKDELEQALYAAWNRLKKAKNYLRAMTASNDAAKDAAAKEKKNLEGLVTNRRKNILERIALLCAERAS